MSRTPFLRVLVAGAAAAGAMMLAGPEVFATAKTQSVVVVAAHAKVAANSVSTSRITVKVHVGRSTARNVAVRFTLAGSPAASCGALSITAGRTNRSGILQSTYRTSSSPGFCTASAAVGRATGGITIVQTSPAVPTPYAVTLTPKSDGVYPNAVTFLRVTVASDATPVSADPVMITEVPLEPGACGTLSPGSMTTNADGQVTVAYTASSAVGKCQLDAAEALSGSTSNRVVVWQSKLPVG
jgi:hypothetical protein